MFNGLYIIKWIQSNALKGNVMKVDIIKGNVIKETINVMLWKCNEGN